MFTTKLTDILKSVRFWIVTLTALLAILQSYVDAGHLWNVSEVLTIVQVWLATVAGIGTLDSVAERVGGSFKKK